MTRDCRKMMKYYRVVLREVGITYNLNPDDIHELFKKGLKVETTSTLDFDQRYEYLDLSLSLIRIAFDMYFDSEGRKMDGISRVRLYGSEKPDNRKSLRQTE